MVDEVVRAEEDVHTVREIIAYFRAHADELRSKGLPVDDMIRDLERQVAEVIAAATRARDLRAEDELLTEKRENLRRQIDELTTRLPPDLVDGMATSSYLRGAMEREVRRKPRERKKVGG